MTPLTHTLTARVIAVIALCLLGPMAVAQNALTITQSGRITQFSDDQPLSGLHTFTFRIYESASADDTTALWEEVLTLNLDNGYYSATLGENVPLGGLFTQLKSYFLGIQVNSDPVMSPRLQLTA